MSTKTALFALLAVWGVGTCASAPALAQGAGSTAGEASGDPSPAKRSFTNRVWTQTGADELPGVMRIFLSDGTLVADSCWETHRLSEWQSTSATAISWDEDGREITAEIVSVTASDLVLDVNVGDETVRESYTAASVPFVCPDLPQGNDG